MAICGLFSYSHGIAVAGCGAEQLMITLDAGHALDDIASNIQAECNGERRPPDLKRDKQTKREGGRESK